MAADTAGWLVEITPCVRFQGGLPRVEVTSELAC